MTDKIGSYEATDAFEHGVLWCAARLVEIYDEPTMAAELIEQAGVDVSKADGTDKPFIDQALA